MSSIRVKNKGLLNLPSLILSSKRKHKKGTSLEDKGGFLLRSQKFLYKENVFIE